MGAGGGTRAADRRMLRFDWVPRCPLRHWLPPDRCPSRSLPRPRLGRVGIADTRNDLEDSPSRHGAAEESDSVACQLGGSIPDSHMWRFT